MYNDFKATVELSNLVRNNREHHKTHQVCIQETLKIGGRKPLYSLHH